jgi:hypothetical protein
VVVDEDGKVVGYPGNAVLDARINVRDRTEVREGAESGQGLENAQGVPGPPAVLAYLELRPQFRGRRSVLREAWPPPNSRVILPESG